MTPDDLQRQIDAARAAISSVGALSDELLAQAAKMKVRVEAAERAIAELEATVAGEPVAASSPGVDGSPGASQEPVDPENDPVRLVAMELAAAGSDAQEIHSALQRMGVEDDERVLQEVLADGEGPHRRRRSPFRERRVDVG